MLGEAKKATKLPEVCEGIVGVLERDGRREGPE